MREIEGVVAVALAVALLGGCPHRETLNECVSRMVWKEHAKDWAAVNKACDHLALHYGTQGARR